MRKTLLTSLAVLAGIGLAAAAPARASEDGAIGSWQRSEPSGQAGLNRLMNLRILPNGVFELRSAQAAPGKQPSGYVLVTGRYEMSGGSFVSSSVHSVFCASVSSCVPDPTGGKAAGVASLNATLQVTGPDDMVLNGNRWTRQN